MVAGERTAQTAVWQDVEFGAYTGDLALWEELAAGAEGSVVEIGAGAGRVSLHLARKGRQVVSLERDEELVAELRRRAGEAGVLIAAQAVDVTEPGRAAEVVAKAGGPSPAGLAIAPLHLIQQVEPASRPNVIENAASMLREGSLFAAVVVDESSFLYEDDPDLEPRPPDMREVGGWVYASEPLWLQVDEEQIRVRRLRKRVAPDGEIERSVHDELLHRIAPDQLEEEARRAGLVPAGRRTITSDSGEADSIAVLLRVPS
jgi:predicted O-methyltransferase YrrM